ncbi:MAG: Nuclease [Verrucomicrobia bacterium]|nr:Nuclease [Verrucomicrobiota bacterium]
MKSVISLRLAALLALLAAPASLRAWDYEGHRTVNQLALAALPKDFPAFVREAASVERVSFLAGEPDRWRNVPDQVMRQSGGSWADHYIDMEDLPDAGLDPATVSSFRYDFILAYAVGRAAHPQNFPAIDPAKNSDHTREWPGFLPWAITEYYGRLKSAFTYLKTFEELGTPEEIANARANILYQMGTMGHYVGDCAQPLHATKHHHGWVGANPNGYTTWKGFHSWIDGTFILKAGITTGSLAGRIAPAQALPLPPRTDGRDPLFVAVMEYAIAQSALVEPLYKLEKAGKLSDEAEKNDQPLVLHGPVDPEGRAFVEGQLLKGGQMLASIWITAWRNTVPDSYLRAQLLKRQAAKAAPAKSAP